MLDEPVELVAGVDVPEVLLDVVDVVVAAVLDGAAALPYVREYSRNGVATVDLSAVEAIPDLVDALVAAGARLTRVEPQTPSLEQLYFEIRSRT